MNPIDPADADDPAEPSVPDESAPDAVPLCINCLAEIEGRTAFCSACGAPVGAFTAMDPMQSIRTSGWFYRRVKNATTTRLGLVGVWLIFGPLVVSVMLSFPDLFQYVPRRLDLREILASIPGIIIFVTEAVILYGATRSFLKSRRCKQDTEQA